MVWVGLTLAAVLWRRRGRSGLTLLAVSLAYIPAILLLGAALEPSLTVERLLVGVGAPLAAARPSRAAQARSASGRRSPRSPPPPRSRSGRPRST